MPGLEKSVAVRVSMGFGSNIGDRKFFTNYSRSI
jgi:hypothetical protein